MDQDRELPTETSSADLYRDPGRHPDRDPGRGPGRRALLSTAGAAVAVLAVAAPARATGRRPAAPVSAGGARPLTNLSHLDFLRTRVRPPAQPGHTTIDLDTEPSVGVLWVYAEADGAGGFRRVGGGTFDPATGRYGQGAYDTDDVARAAVVYLRHWRSTGSASSRAAARDLLRGLTFLQTVSGPNAGRPVLWMQSDGTLNPSANPPELPDPSDSGPSYWLARTVWALGEGYAAFRDSDSRFANFLGDRLDLAVTAGRRDIGPSVGHLLAVDGRRAPAWLVVDGADASAEAVLGLASYVRAASHARPGPTRTARRVLAVLADGIARQQAGDAWTWPFGAVLPSARSASSWHAWAGNAPAALARAGAVLADDRLVAAAGRDAITFTSHLFVSGGPDSGWSPLPTDRSQIAYGADGRVAALAELAAVSGRDAHRRLAGMAASWFFGANRAGRAVYDPATGVVTDGIAADGTLNGNAGAESTIHALLTMLVLDGDPVAAGTARVRSLAGRVPQRVLEAERGTLLGGATVVPPPAGPPTVPLPTEYRLSGDSAALLPPSASVVLPGTVPAGSLVYAAVHRVPGAATVRVAVAGRLLGSVSSTGSSAGDDSPDPGVLLPALVATAPVTGRAVLTASPTGAPVEVDAVVVQPPVEAVVLTGAGGGSALVRSFDRVDRGVRVPVPGDGPLTVDEFGADGLLRSTRQIAGARPRVTVGAGGTVLLTRTPD